MEQKEIERKFILRKLPNQANKISEVSEISQYYSPSDEGVIRYRRTHFPNVDRPDVYEKIIKLPVADGVNVEKVFNCSKEIFENECPKNAKAVFKTRYTFYCGLKYEIDVFNDICLVMMEMEFQDESFLKKEIYHPDWIQKEVIAEVTGMKEFNNYNLAQ